YLEQGTPQCDPQHSAKAYKMLFIPNKTMDFTLICNMPSIAITDGGPMKLDFVNGEAGTTYEFLITHRVYGVVCDDETTFIVETEFGRGEGMVHASCGD
ncbi:MAG TPA: hypothetical protein VFE50_15135, partial [Cyclobacteriaceae bacterium]|nr:hypothetical protein [Cyclobacteriaceae bacterium]